MYLGTSYIYWDLSIYSKNKSRVRGYAARLKTKYEVMEAYLELIWGVDSGNKVLYPPTNKEDVGSYFRRLPAWVYVLSVRLKK